MIIRYASEGKYLTNGETYTDSIYAPDDYNPADWWEVDEIPEVIEIDDEEAFRELMKELG